MGAGQLNGRFIRWGLANESKAMNERFKSADLIGVRPVLITQEMVGTVIGQFASVEVKRTKGGVTHEAQANWRDVVNSLGGHAIITNGDDLL